jgi:hypothetical protein
LIVGADTSTFFQIPTYNPWWMDAIYLTIFQIPTHNSQWTDVIPHRFLDSNS